MWRLIPVILSCLILAAHFYRSGTIVLSILCVLVAFLPFYKATLIPRLMQLFLILGTLEWIRIIIIRISERMDLGEPWLRLLIILGFVALITLLSVFIFENNIIKQRYFSGKNDQL